MPTPPLMDLDRLCEVLPHRPPALLIERVTEVKPGEYAVGLKEVRPGDSFLEGHFPGLPVMPGAAIIECMAQVAGVLTQATAPEAVSESGMALLGIDKTRFRRAVFPGDTLRIEVRVLQRRDPVWKFQARASVGDERAAEALLVAGLTSKGQWGLSASRTKPGDK